jgi:hypothetical protein
MGRRREWMSIWSGCTKSVESAVNDVRDGGCTIRRVYAFLGILSVSGIPEESRTRSLKLGSKSSGHFGK